MVTVTAGRVGPATGICAVCGVREDLFSLPLTVGSPHDGGRLRAMFAQAGARGTPQLERIESGAGAEQQVYVTVCRAHLHLLAALHHRVHTRGRLSREDVQQLLALPERPPRGPQGPR